MMKNRQNANDHAFERTCLSDSKPWRPLLGCVFIFVFVAANAVAQPEIEIPKGHEKPAFQLEDYVGPELFAISDDRSRIVTYRKRVKDQNPSYELKLWDMKTGKELGTFDEPYELSSLDISPSGKGLVASGAEHNIQLWSMNTHRVNYHIRFRTTRKEDLGKIRFSPRGDQFYCVTPVNITSYSTNSGVDRRETTGSWRFPDMAWVKSIQVFPVQLTRDRNGNKSRIDIYLYPYKRLVKRIETKDEVQRVALSPSGNLLAAAFREGNIRLWQIPGWTELPEIIPKNPGEVKGYRGLAISPDGKILAAIPIRTQQATTEVWNIPQKQVQQIGPQDPRQIEFLSDETLVIASPARPIGFFHAGTGRMVPRPEPIIRPQTEVVKEEPAAKPLTPLEQARSLRKQGEFAKAIPMFRELMKAAREQSGGTSQDALKLMRLLADAHRSAGDYDEAAQIFERCFELSEPKITRETRDAPNDLEEVTETDLCRGKRAEAEARLVKVLAQRKAKHGERHPAVADVEFLLGRISEFSADPITAHKHYLTSLDIRRKTLGPNHADLARSLAHVGLTYWDCQKVAEAVEHLEESAKMYSEVFGFIHPRTGLAKIRLSSPYRKLERLQEANSVEKQATVALYNTDYETPEGVAVMTRMAGLMAQGSGVPKAELTYKQALDFAERLLGPQHITMAHVHTGLGTHFLKQERDSLAIRHFREALKIAEIYMGTSSPLLEEFLRNLAGAYRSAKQFDLAHSTYKRAMALRTHRIKDLDQIQLHLEFAESYLDQEDWTKAGDQYHIGILGLHKFLTRLQPFQPEPRKYEYDQICRNCLSTPLSAVARHSDRQELVNYSAEWVANFKGLGAAALVERHSASWLSPNGTNEPISDELQTIHKNLSELLEYNARIGVGPIGKIFVDQLDQQEKLETDRSTRRGQPMLADRWVSLDQIRSALDKETVLVEFFSDGNRNYAAWIIPPRGQGEVQFVNLGPILHADRAITDFREALRESFEKANEKGIHDKWNRANQALYAKFLAPLEKPLENYDRWLISPEGAIWGIPWPALRVRDGRYLVESTEVCLLTSPRELVVKTQSLEPTRPLVVTRPDYNFGLPGKSRGTEEFDNLPEGVQATEPLIRKLASSTQNAPVTFSGEEAEEAKVKEYVRPRVLGFFSRPFFYESIAADNPFLRSGIALAGANGAGLILLDRTRDGKLTSWDAATLDLRGTEIVMLIDWETRGVKLHPVDGVRTLQHAFQIAGAKTVLSTLWAARAKEAPTLIATILEETTKGRRPSAALREAQLQTLRTEQTAHPVHWAGFVINSTTNQ